MWVNSKANLAAKRHRKKKKKSQRGRDLKEFLWQMHPDRLSDRDRGRFERREARRRQHGALNYKDRREARRVARRRGQDGISALADADAALADVALAEAGAAAAAAAAQGTTAGLQAVWGGESA